MINKQNNRRTGYTRILCLALALCLLTAARAQAQKKTTDRADFSAFKKQIMALQEYRDERQKIPKLQKDHKGQQVKVIAVVDKEPAEPDADLPGNILTGGIRQVIGTDTSAVYDVEYDRTTKKITGVKPTGEGTDPEEAEKKTRHHKDDEDDDTEKEPKSRKEKDDE